MSVLNSASARTRSTIASASSKRASMAALNRQNIEPSSLSALQSSLQKAMEEMGRVSTILESNVPQVMQSQMDMQEDVLGVFTEAR